MNKNEMMALRNSGLSNKEIAARAGYSYNTVLKTIGKQPVSMSLTNRKIGQAKVSMEKLKFISNDEKRRNKLNIVMKMLREVHP